MKTLFRGLRTDGKGWVYGSYHYCTGTGEMRHHEWDDKGNRIVTKTVTFNSHFILEHRTPDSVSWDVRNTFIPYDVIAETVGQFTGLKDMEDTDIYEGDILDINRKRAVVSFDKGCFLTIIGESNYRLGGWSLEAVNIIGNIHEHAHLFS